MKTILVLFAVVAAGAAGYLVGDEGRVSTQALVAGGAGLVALVLWQIVPAAAPAERVSMRRGESRPGRGPATPRGRALHPGEAARVREQERVLSEKPVVGVRLLDAGRNQIAVIKVLRNHFDIGLKEAKDLTDGAKKGANPLLTADLEVLQARKLGEDIEAAGGRVEFE